MRIIIIIFLISVNLSFYGQISLTGSANYKFTIDGHQGKDRSACGNIFGLREINIFYQDGSTENLWKGRIWNEYFHHEKEYSKRKKITKVEIYSINRWDIWSGCDGGPNHDRKSLNITNTCFNQFFENPVHVTKDVTLKSYPIVTINIDINKQYILGDTENLKISLLDNLNNSDYNWKYSIAGQSPLNIPSGYNNRPILDIPASEFLSQAKFGDVISVWVDTGCNADDKNSNILTFVYLKSAPHIVDHQALPVKCFDSQDGSVTLKFDRALVVGETLEYTLFNTITGASEGGADLTNLLQNSTSATINNLPPGNYKLDLSGTYNGNVTYTDGDKHSILFDIERPTAVDFSFVSKTDVFCHQGSDGIINISATGGQNKYQYSVVGNNGVTIDWTDFNNRSNTSIPNLPAGTYQITVQDSNLCPAKENGNIKIITKEITEPSAPIALSELEIKEPTGYGLSNGYISIRVTGGTPYDNKTYNLEWRKDTPTGAIIYTGIITDAINNPFTIKLENITKGKYYLTVKDKNYANASSNLNTCGIISQEYEVNQPDSLIATIEVKKIISCHIENDYQYKLDLDNNDIPDEAETGELSAIVTGGVGKYSYQWLELVGNSFQDISGAALNTLSKLKEGTYQVLVKDVNDNRAHAIKVFNYPDKLSIRMSANTILCNNQNGGIVSVSVTGGTPPYTYYWNTADTTDTVSGLSAGNYFVVVQDANNCTINGNVRIEQPGQLEIEDILIQDPICNGASNGAIQIKAKGGVAPYSIVWSNGRTGEVLSGLEAGTYIVSFTDANGCTVIKDYILENPEALTIDLGKDITLCQGDSQTFDAAINDPEATYEWTNTQGDIIGTGSSIVLSEAGIYTARVIDSKGCMASDEVEIRNSMEVLSPEFMIASHAFVDRTVELVNTSSIKPERIEWILPESEYITVVSESDEHIELKFSLVGSYRVGIKGMQGLCEKTMFKDILVEENIYGVEEPATTSSNIKDFIILPNPNDGNYKVIVELHKEASIKLRTINISGKASGRVITYPASSKFEIPFSQSLVTGVYLILLETGSEVLVKRMLVNY